MPPTQEAPEKEDEAFEVDTISNGESVLSNDGSSTKLSLWEAALFIFNGVVGVAIMSSAGDTFKFCGDNVAATLFVWILTPCSILLIAFCYAELGSMFGSSGGEYQYYVSALHEYVGSIFVVTVAALTLPASAAYFCSFLAKQLFSFSKDYDEFVPSHRAISWTIGCILVMCFTYFNIRFQKLAIKFGNIASMFKVVLISMLVIIGVVSMVLYPFEIRMSQSCFVRSGSFPAGLKNIWTNITTDKNPFCNAVFVFDGWTAIASISSTVSNPERNIPRAITISISLISIVYIIINSAYMLILTPDQFKGTTIAQDMIKNLIEKVSFLKKFSGQVKYFMTVVLVIGASGSLNGLTFATGQILSQFGQNGSLPRFFAKKSSSGAPFNAFLAYVALTILYLSLSFSVPEIDAKYFQTYNGVQNDLTFKFITKPLSKMRGLPSLVSYMSLAFYALSAIALLVLRGKKGAKLERGFRVWTIVPVTFLVLVLAIMLSTIKQSWFVYVAISIFGGFAYFMRPRGGDSGQIFEDD